MRDGDAFVSAPRSDLPQAVERRSRQFSFGLRARGALALAALAGYLAVMCLLVFVQESETLRALESIDAAAARPGDVRLRTEALRAERIEDAAALVAIGFTGIFLLGAAILRFLVTVDRRAHELELVRRKDFHQEKMAAIGSLAAGVLTEIGNPIAAIDGLARAMKEEREGRPAASLACTPEAILEQTARLMVVAHQISEFAAPQPSHRQLVDLNAVVESAIGLLRFDETIRAMRVELALDRQLPAIPGMTDRLVQAVMCIIGNAADAVRAGPARRGALRISTCRSGAAVALSIADDGVGMTEAVRRRAFEPFFSTKPRGQGTGLGLPLCRSIAEDHGGRIELESAPFRGTRVTITLPIASPGLPPDPSA
jgi:signal transduction histidine kinase